MQNANILAIRAVTAQYGLQLLRVTTYWTVAIFALVLIGVMVLAATVSSWWNLLLIPVVVLGSVAGIVWLITRALLRRFMPRLTSVQRTTVKGFVRKVAELSETIQTPYFIIIFYLVRDMVTRRSPGYMQQLATSSTDIARDFDLVKHAFVIKK